MTTNFYFTHPIAASFDPRIHALEEKLHGKGYGLYWYIREKLSYFPKKCCRLENLKPFATKYYTYRLIQKVVLESGLFEIEEGYIIPLKLVCEGGTIDEEATCGDTTDKSQRGNKTSRKNSGTEAKNSRKRTKNNFAFIISDDSSESKNSRTESKNSRTESKNSRKRTKNSENPSISDENSLKNDENPVKNDENPSKNSGKQAKNGKKRTENDEKQAIFNEKQAFFDGKQAKNSGKQVRKTSQKQSEYADKQVFVHDLFKTSNTNTPIYIKKEKEKERKIISSTEKEEEEEKEEKSENAVNDRNVPPAPPSLPPVRFWQQYVAYLGTDRQWVEIACMKNGSDTPYSHRQQLGGRRMYNGPPIPDNASPRPGNHFLWNDRLQRWSRIRVKKTPHLCPIPLGFAKTLPRIYPENPTGIEHKPHENRT